MFKTIATAALTVGLTVGGVGAATASSHGGERRITHANLDSVSRWEGWHPTVAQALNHAGHYVRSFTDVPPCDGCGVHFAERSYPATTAGEYALVTYWHYVTPRTADQPRLDYGWVLWSKSWCDASGCVAQ